MNLISRVKNMLTTPKTEWLVVASEEPDSGKIVMGYVVPLALIGAVAAFIGYGLIGFSVLGVRIHSTNWGLYYAIVTLVQLIVSLYLTALILDALAPSFKSEKNFGRSMQLVAYGATPSLVASFFNILPMVAGILGLAATVYSIYLWYIGMGPVKKTPDEQRVGYLVVSILVLIVIYFILGMIMARLLMGLFGLSLFGL